MKYLARIPSGEKLGAITNNGPHAIFLVEFTDGVQATVPASQHHEDEWIKLKQNERVAYQGTEIAKLKSDLRNCQDEANEVLRNQRNEIARLKAEVERRGNLLEDVINELDLSDSVVEQHGPMGTDPSKLVRQVLDQKDRTITMLKQGIQDV